MTISLAKFNMLQGKSGYVRVDRSDGTRLHTYGTWMGKVLCWLQPKDIRKLEAWRVKRDFLSALREEYGKSVYDKAIKNIGDNFYNLNRFKIKNANEILKKFEERKKKYTKNENKKDIEYSWEYSEYRGVDQKFINELNITEISIYWLRKAREEGNVLRLVKDKSGKFRLGAYGNTSLGKMARLRQPYGNRVLESLFIKKAFLAYFEKNYGKEGVELALDKMEELHMKNPNRVLAADLLKIERYVKAGKIFSKLPDEVGDDVKKFLHSIVEYPLEEKNIDYSSYVSIVMSSYKKLSELYEKYNKNENTIPIKEIWENIIGNNKIPEKLDRNNFTLNMSKCLDEIRLIFGIQLGFSWEEVYECLGKEEFKNRVGYAKKILLKNDIKYFYGPKNFFKINTKKEFGKDCGRINNVKYIFKKNETVDTINVEKPKQKFIINKKKYEWSNKKKISDSDLHKILEKEIIDKVESITAGDRVLAHVLYQYFYQAGLSFFTLFGALVGEEINIDNSSKEISVEASKNGEYLVKIVLNNNELNAEIVVKVDKNGNSTFKNIDMRLKKDNESETTKTKMNNSEDDELSEIIED